jgi:hypothetical protein
MAKIGKDVAEQQFERLCKSRRIETDLSELNETEKTTFRSRKADIIRLMMSGALVLDQAGNPVYTPPTEGAKPITFHKATGATLMEADGSLGQVERLIRIATALTKSVPGELSTLDLPDFHAVDEIVTFLIGR